MSNGNKLRFLIWNPVDGAMDYNVYQSVTSATYGDMAMTVTGSVYSAAVTGPTNGTEPSIISR